MRGSFQTSVFSFQWSVKQHTTARSVTWEGYPPAWPISLGRRGNKQGSTGVSPVIDTRMASSSMSNNAFSQHGRDDHAPLFALLRGSALVPPKVGMARRRRPTCAATPPLRPETALQRLKLGTPTARHPYHFLRKVLPHQHPRGSANLKLTNLNLKTS